MAQASESAWVPTPVALAPPLLLTRAVTDGRRLGLQLSYVEGAGKALNQAGAAWFAPRRMWVIDAAAPEAVQAWLRQVFAGRLFDFDAVLPLLRAAQVPEADFFTQLLDLQLMPIGSGDGPATSPAQPRRFAVTSAYDACVVNAMRALRGRFHRHASAWEVNADAGTILQALKEHAGVAADFVFVHEREVVLEDLVAAPKGTLSIAVPAAPPPRGEASDKEEEGAGFLSVIAAQSQAELVDEAELARLVVAAGLRDYQVAGVRHLARQTSACLGDDMGLGKSRQTVVAARLVAGQGRVLIVCPASLRINWEREIRAVFPDAVVGMVGEDRLPTLYGCGWVVTNYERLGGLVRETGLDFAVMAIDEAHYLKEHQAGRTRNAFILAGRIPRCFVVTGTPLLNREIELHTLLRLSGHRLGLLPLTTFRKQFAGGKEQRLALAQALSGWMLRRRKDVLKDLGTKVRQLRHIAPSEGLGAYEAIVKDMSLMVMPKIGKLRQCLEALKSEFIVETLESLSAGDKAIVFCQYMPTVDQLRAACAAAGIGCVSLVGSDSMTKRQKAVDAFQQDPAVTVFLTTIAAGGVGITLTAANYVIFASLPWTPAVMRQAEDRAYRLGQLRNVIVIVPKVPRTIDEQVWKLLDAKTEVEADVVEASVRAELEAA